jgi:N-acetylmuramoyl-L-alanine amidase
MRAINRIIIHCSATKQSLDVGVEEIRKWHMKGNGWKDIGYHYVIRLDGSIEKGRPIEQVGAHTSGHNSDSIGICYVGGVDNANKPKDTLNPKQEKSLEALVKKLRERWPKLTISGHNDYTNAKACPSFKVSERLKHLI